MAEFRKTNTCGVEVLSKGVWTTVPPEAADEINRLRALLAIAAEVLEDLGACADPNCDEANCLHALVKIRGELDEQNR